MELIKPSIVGIWNDNKRWDLKNIWSTDNFGSSLLVDWLFLVESNFSVEIYKFPSRKENPFDFENRDIFLGGDLQDNCLELINKLGWKEEFEALKQETLQSEHPLAKLIKQHAENKEENAKQ